MYYNSEKKRQPKDERLMGQPRMNFVLNTDSNVPDDE
jgi:hypothetical protein